MSRRGAMYYRENREELIRIQDEVLTQKDVQPGYPTWGGHTRKGLPYEPGQEKGVTWCNRGAERIARLAGVDTRPVLHKKGIGYTSANSMYKFASISAKKGIIREVDTETAQILSWNGFVILAAAQCVQGNRPGHVVILRPTPLEEEQLCANVGATMGVMTVKWAFAVNYLSPVRYFLLPRGSL